MKTDSTTTLPITAKKSVLRGKLVPPTTLRSLIGVGISAVVAFNRSEVVAKTTPVRDFTGSASYDRSVFWCCGVAPLAEAQTGTNRNRVHASA